MVIYDNDTWARVKLRAILQADRVFIIANETSWKQCIIKLIMYMEAGCYIAQTIISPNYEIHPLKKSLHSPTHSLILILWMFDYNTLLHSNAPFSASYLVSWLLYYYYICEWEFHSGYVSPFEP